MAKGEIISWFEDRGFGFIKPDGIAFGDIFVHRNQIVQGVPCRGARVRYELHCHKPKRATAKNVEVLT